MIRRSGIAGAPASYLQDDGEWPDGPLVPDAPVPVLYAQEVSRRLRDTLEETTVAAVGRDADLSRVAIHDILSGRTWPELVTLSKLEAALDVTLWPDEELRRADGADRP